MDALDPENGIENSPENSKAKNLDKLVVRSAVPGMEKTAPCSWNPPWAKHCKDILTEKMSSLSSRAFSCTCFGSFMPALTVRTGKGIRKHGQLVNVFCPSEEGLLCFLVHLCHHLHTFARLKHVVSKQARCGIAAVPMSIFLPSQKERTILP